MTPMPMGQARSDGSGRFRLDAPRVSSSRHEVFGILATAPGYGAGWAALDPDADQPAAEITIRPEQVIQGRMFDVQGRPVRGVTVSVENMRTIPRDDPDEAGRPYFLTGPATDLPAWPRPPITDADGRFTIRARGEASGSACWSTTRDSPG